MFQTFFSSPKIVRLDTYISVCLSRTRLHLLFFLLIALLQMFFYLVKKVCRILKNLRPVSTAIASFGFNPFCLEKRLRQWSYFILLLTNSVEAFLEKKRSQRSFFFSLLFQNTWKITWNQRMLMTPLKLPSSKRPYFFGQ